MSYRVKPAEGRICNEEDGTRVPAEGRTFEGDVSPWFIRRERDGDCEILAVGIDPAAKPKK